MSSVAYFPQSGTPVEVSNGMETPTEPHTVEKTTISMKTEHGDDAAIESIRRNWPILSGLIVFISLFAVAHSRISEMSIMVEDMRKNGHAEHEQHLQRIDESKADKILVVRDEQRITQLESQKADQTGLALNQLTKQVSDMVVAFNRDHDALMRMVVMYERIQTAPPK